MHFNSCSFPDVWGQHYLRGYIAYSQGNGIADNYSLHLQIIQHYKLLVKRRTPDSKSLFFACYYLITTLKI